MFQSIHTRVSTIQCSQMVLWIIKNTYNIVCWQRSAMCRNTVRHYAIITMVNKMFPKQFAKMGMCTSWKTFPACQGYIRRSRMSLCQIKRILFGLGRFRSPVTMDVAGPKIFLRLSSGSELQNLVRCCHFRIYRITKRTIRYTIPNNCWQPGGIVHWKVHVSTCYR